MEAPIQPPLDRAEVTAYVNENLKWFRHQYNEAESASEKEKCRAEYRSFHVFARHFALSLEAENSDPEIF
jgi:predicted metal-dependent hydrolase